MAATQETRTTRSPPRSRSLLASEGLSGVAYPPQTGQGDAPARA
jgi:hypothetical protein